MRDARRQTTHRKHFLLMPPIVFFPPALQCAAERDHRPHYFALVETRRQFTIHGKCRPRQIDGRNSGWQRDRQTLRNRGGQKFVQM